MNPLGTRAGAEELARLLDGAVAGPGSLSARHAALATRLRAVAPSLAAATTPRPEFRAALRQRLVAVATVQAAAEVPFAEPVTRPKALDAAVSWTQTRRAQRRIGVTAGAMAGVVAFTGVGIAASRSLPGQPFYGLKTAEEGLELRFAGSETEKGSKHLEFASTRLREVTALAQGDGELALGAPGVPVASSTAFGRDLPTKIDDTLAAFDEQTRQGQSLLESAYRKTGKPEPLRILTAFSAQQKAALWAVLPSLPATTQDDAQESLGLVTAVGADAGQLLALGTCGGECFPGNAGPTLPTEPVPAPGVSADPTATAAPSTDDNGVPPCTCAPSPSPSPSPAASPSPEPIDEPTPSPTPSPSPSKTPSPGPLDPIVDPLESLLPTPLPTITLPPLPEPIASLLPEPLASLLPSILPLP